MEMPVADALTRYLDLQSQRMRVTASNMANIDTPGYRTAGIDFQSAFSQALDTHGTAAPVEANEVQGLISRPDCNKVSMDMESMQMSETHLQFRTGIELLKHQFSMLSEAIKSDGH